MSITSLRAHQAFPSQGEIELTYRCNFRCPHCYCRGSELVGREMTLQELKNIIDQILDAGCLELCFTGGEPLLRRDFSKIYSYAKEKGFFITVFTNGSLINKDILRLFREYPPRAVEITLNANSSPVFDEVSRTRGNYRRVQKNLRALIAAGIPLVLKSVAMTLNKNELISIKNFSESLLGKGRYRMDSLIVNRLNGSRAPSRFRLSPEEIDLIEDSDPDMRAQRDRSLQGVKRLPRGRNFLFQCDVPLRRFTVDPFGRLKFCGLSSMFSADLRKEKFKDAFYRVLTRFKDEKFKTKSRCRNCELRMYCWHCPARCFLETGSCEAPAPYFCRLAKFKKELKEKMRS